MLDPDTVVTVGCTYRGEERGTSWQSEGRGGENSSSCLPATQPQYKSHWGGKGMVEWGEG